MVAVLVSTMALAKVEHNRNRGRGKLFPTVVVDKRKADAPARHIMVSKPQPKPVSYEDTAAVLLYRGSVKQNGWMRGAGKPISAETASHLNTHLKFSNRNRAGHFTKAEFLDACGRPFAGWAGTYLVHPRLDSDSLIDQNWKSKLGTVTTWEFVGDETGENCIQENAYDKDGNLVYSYYPVKIADNMVMGHYVDAWGLPVALRGDNGAKYVVITRDPRGYETDIRYVTDGGFPATNMNSAYRAEYDYNSLGNQIKEMSQMPDGRYMIDDARNTGHIDIYDDNGFELVATSFGPDGEPIRSSEGAIQKRYEYDSLGRIVQQTYHLADGTPDTNPYGVHKEIFGYNDRGLLISQINYGIDGKPAEGEYSWAIFEADYDDEGNQTLWVFKNADGRYIDSPAYCRVEYTYDGGELATQRLYRVDASGNIYQSFDYVKDGLDEKSIDLETGRIMLSECYDDGQIRYRKYFDLDSNPAMTDGFHFFERKRETSGKVATEGEFFYDTQMQLADMHSPEFKGTSNKQIVVYDSVRGIATRYIYDGDKLQKSFAQVFSDNMSRIEGEFGIDDRGEIARTRNEGALYYETSVGLTIRGGLSYFGMLNEYGEAAYGMESDDPRDKFYTIRIINDQADLDEDGKPVYGYTLDEVYRVGVIEVTDTACSEEIRSGDVIMAYGDFHMPVAENSDAGEDNMENLTTAMFEEADHEKDMVVMRRNPATNKAEYKIIKLPKGTPSDFGFIMHRIYYTKAEKQRYDETYQKYLAENSPVLVEADSASKRTVILGRPLRFNMSNIAGAAVNNGWLNNGIILATMVRDSLDNPISYISGMDSIDYDAFLIKNGCAPGKKRVWYTTDMKTIRHFDHTEQTGRNGLYMTDASVNEATALKCKKMAESLIAEMKAFSDSVAYRPIIYGSVEDTTAYMGSHGLRGEYFILKLNDWTFGGSMNDFHIAFNGSAGKTRHFVLAKIVEDEDRLKVGEVVDLKSDQPMGFRIREVPDEFGYVRPDLEHTLKKAKRRKL